MAFERVRIQEVFPTDELPESILLNYAQEGVPVAQWGTERFTIIDRTQLNGRTIISAVSGGDEMTSPESVVLDFNELRPGAYGTLMGS
jgi:hypothetical protein